MSMWAGRSVGAWVSALVPVVDGPVRSRYFFVFSAIGTYVMRPMCELFSPRTFRQHEEMLPKHMG